MMPKMTMLERQPRCVLSRDQSSAAPGPQKETPGSTMLEVWRWWCLWCCHGVEGIRYFGGRQGGGRSDGLSVLNGLWVSPPAPVVDCD